MKSATFSIENSLVICNTPYNRDFVDALKESVPHTERKWVADKKLWVVTDNHGDKVVALAKEHFDSVIDNRSGDVDVESEKLEAEIAQAQADRDFIVSHTGDIEAIIGELSDVISRYSYGSVSRVKAAYAKDRALLQHSLDNARTPVDEMTELQIRGLSAARRYLESNNFSMERH